MLMMMMMTNGVLIQEMSYLVSPNCVNNLKLTRVLGLSEIKLPAMMRKRGRLKGAEQTVIGLPRKKRRGNKPLPFLKKSPSDKEKGINLSVYTIVINSVHMYVVILMWFLSPEIANAAISGKIVQKEEVNLTSQLVPASCLDDNICIETCRKYFTHSAWEEIKKVVDEMKNHPVWYCGRCMLPIRDYIDRKFNYL